jgi:membrane-bound lytic murein transglycosylase B
MIKLLSAALRPPLCRSLRTLLFSVLLLPMIGACARASDYADHPETTSMIDRLVANDGFERAELEALFAQARRQQSILDAIARPAEKVRPWHEYRGIFLTDRRIREGHAFMREHAATLARAERESGVPAELIAAIIGVETFYGRITGGYSVLDALSTLAFDYPPRSPFFSSELRHFLLLTRDQGLDPAALKGSYAGAMGYGQFMPSSYRSYAVDFDGDGLTDIWDNPVDAIGSVANYLRSHGWRAGEPVVLAARATADVPTAWVNAGLKPKHTLAELAAAGLEPAGEADAASAETVGAEAQAAVFRFELADGYEYWLGLHNFYVITRYNHSSMYAMSVYQLAQRLGESAAG